MKAKSGDRAVTPTDEPMNLQEAAAYLKVSRPTMKDLLDGGLIRHTKLAPRLYRIERTALDAYLASVTKGPEAPATP